MSDDVRSCPLCGRTPKVQFLGEIGRFDQFEVECDPCQLSMFGPLVSGEDAARQAAIEAWNRRKPEMVA